MVLGFPCLLSGEGRVRTNSRQLNLSHQVSSLSGWQANGYQFKPLRDHMEPNTAQRQLPSSGCQVCTYRHLCKFFKDWHPRIVLYSSLGTTYKLEKNHSYGICAWAVCV